NLANFRSFVAPSAASRVSPLQEAPTAVGDSILPVSSSTPALPAPSPKVEASSPSPATSEPASAVPAAIRTGKRGGQNLKVALEVYGSSDSAVLDWIKKNNPQLRNLNRLEVGTQLTLPPLPAGIR